MMPFGTPVEPDVYMMYARSDSSILTGGASVAVAATISLHAMPGNGIPSWDGTPMTHSSWQRVRPSARNPRSFEPTTEMPAFEGTEAELRVLLDYLSTLTDE